MPKTTLLFDDNGLDFIEFDATTQEGHSHNLEVTSHPVERGADVSDHARIKADTLPLNVCVSDGDTPGKSGDLYERLRLLQDKATLLTVITTLRTYDDMVLESISAPRTAKDAGGLYASVTFKQVILVQNKTTVVEVTKDPITKKKKSNGKQPPKVAADGEQKEKTIIKNFSDSTGLLDGIDALIRLF